MKILITGGRGYLGTIFTKVFQKKYDIICLDINELDITKKDQVESVFQQHKPDIVLHFAAVAVTKFCNENPELAHSINVDGAVHIAEACKHIGAKLVFASTEQVFNGNAEIGPFDENDTPIPNTMYGKNKIEAEALIKEILNDVWILRFAWVFGLPEYNAKPSDNILTSTIISMMTNQKIDVPTNEFRGMSYVYELVHNIEKVFSIPFGTYHFGSDNPLERYEIVKLIFETLSSEEHFNTMVQKVPNPYGERRDVRLDCAKLTQQGIEFSSTPDAIKQCLADFGYIKLN